MPKNMRCFLRVAIARDPLVDLWVAHCLDIDVVSQGSNPKEAAEAIREAIVMVVEDDLAHDADPLDREPAPDECWASFEYALKKGEPVADLGPSSGADAQDWVFACLMQVVRPHNSAVDGDPEPDFKLPNLETWQIAGLERLRSSSSAPCH